MLLTRYAKSSRPAFLLYSPQGEQVEVIEVRTPIYTDLWTSVSTLKSAKEYGSTVDEYYKRLAELFGTIYGDEAYPTHANGTTHPSFPFHEAGYTDLWESITTSVQLKISNPQHSSGCGLRGAAGV